MTKPQKRGDLIPDDDEVVRHVPYRKIIFDQNENIVGIFPHAYHLRDGETHLSVSWLNYHSGTRLDRLRGVLVGLRASKDIGAKSALTSGYVLSLKNVAQKAANVNLRFSYAPSVEDKAHSFIHNIKNDDNDLLEALAAEGFTNIKQVRDL